MSKADILDKAIQQAIASGWTGGKHFNWSGDWIGEVPKLWVTSPFPSWPRLLFKTGGVNVETYSYPPELMLFDHDFAKALWGDDEVDNHGWSIKTIRLWANQVAFKYADKLYNVDPNKRRGAIAIRPELNIMNFDNPQSVVQVDKVEYELKKMTGQIPFETHNMNELEIEAATQPAWQYHLQQMVIADDPIKYLGDNIK